jgi:uncharacterized protein (TIGR04255 family)
VARAPVPLRLENDPIIEAVFELRFAGQSNTSELLPGLLFPRFGGRFPRQERLPVADLPKQLAESDPGLRYAPRMRFGGEHQAIMLGERSCMVSCSKPYIGWSNFSALILEFLEALRDTQLIIDVERVSLKYLNVLDTAILPPRFESLRLHAQLGSYDLTTLNTLLRTEIPEGGLLNIVEVHANVVVRAKQGDSFNGLLTSVDTISTSGERFWGNCEQELNHIHSVEKQVFFDLLEPDALRRLGPIWE